VQAFTLRFFVRVLFRFLFVFCVFVCSYGGFPPNDGERGGARGGGQTCPRKAAANPSKDNRPAVALGFGGGPSRGAWGVWTVRVAHE